MLKGLLAHLGLLMRVHENHTAIMHKHARATCPYLCCDQQKTCNVICLWAGDAWLSRAANDNGCA